jgi:hypothetical protein
MAMASRSSVRAFLVEQGGRRLGEAARLRLRVDLCKTAVGNLDGRVCSDAAKGIAARREATKGACCQREKRSARSRRRRAHRGERTYRGNDTETEADSSSGLRRRRRAARLDIAGDRSGVVMPVDRVGDQISPGAKRNAGASQGDNRFMKRSVK